MFSFECSIKEEEIKKTKKDIDKSSIKEIKKKKYY